MSTMIVSVCVVAFALIAHCDAIKASRHSIYTPEGLANLGKILPSVPGQLSGNLTLIADEFIWAENLIFDDFGNLWVTDLFQGIIFKISKDSATGAITKTPWITGFEKLLGLATGPKTTIFFVGVVSSSNMTLSAFDVNTPNASRIIAQTDSCGNGLVYSAASDVLYSASEADFIPFLGRVFYAQNVSHGTPLREAQKLQSGLNDCDGLFLDENTNLLYMSEVLTATLYVYNLTSNPTAGNLQSTPIRTFHAPNMTMLDDMCIVQSIDNTSVKTPSIIAADFWTGKIVAFDVSGQVAGSALATGIANPTSVRRPKKGSVWDNGRNVFITEGGNFFGKTRRVWELTLPAEIDQEK